MGNKGSGLSDTDRIIMDIIWEEGEVSNPSLLADLQGTLDWSRHTLKTYLNRLIEKGLVGSRPVNGRKNVYYPLISREEYMAEETSTYLKDHYEGLSHMVAGLVKREKVSDDEIEKLEQIIQDYKQRKGL